MAASAIARSLPTSTRARSIFVKVVPAPLTSYERRAVLRALQQYGDIDVFKKLKESSAFIAVTAAPTTALSLRADSPIEHALAPQEKHASGSVFSTKWGGGMRNTILEPVEPVRITSKPENETSTTNSMGMALTPKTFTLHIFPSNFKYNYDHEGNVERNVLHGPWPEGAVRQNFIAESLRNSVPSGACNPGLRDWYSGNQLSVASIGFADEGAQRLLGKKRPKGGWAHAVARVRSNENIPQAMKGFKALTTTKARGS